MGGDGDECPSCVGGIIAIHTLVLTTTFFFFFWFDIKFTFYFIRIYITYTNTCPDSFVNIIVVSNISIVVFVAIYNLII